MTGELSDTYVAALQHGLVEPPASTRRIGVVRTTARWSHGVLGSSGDPTGCENRSRFSNVVDENRPTLGPPRDLLGEFQTRKEDLKRRGLCDEGAHNSAWEELDFEERYREHLDADDARTAVAALADLLDDGTDVALVCYENTDSKRCHRTILRNVVESMRE